MAKRVWLLIYGTAVGLLFLGIADRAIPQSKGDCYKGPPPSAKQCPKNLPPDNTLQLKGPSENSGMAIKIIRPSVMKSS